MSGQRIPIQTTATLHKLMFNHYMGAKAAENTDQPIAWVTSGVPVELLHAADIIPLYPENHAALCGAQKVAVDICNIAEEKGFSRDLCSYARTDLGCLHGGNSPVGGMPKPDVVVCCNNICGTVTKWYQELGRHFDVPVIFLDTPFQHDGIGEHAIAYVEAQLEDAVDAIGALTGRPLDMDRLWETVVLSARATALWRETLDLCMHRPSPMTSFDAFVHIAPIVTLRGTQECIEYYEALVAEMKQRVEQGIAAVPGEQYRLGWDNIPIWYKLGALSKRFAQRHACLVVATYSDAWAMGLRTERPESLLRELATVYATVYINQGMEKRVQVLADMIERYSLDGVILHSNRSCKAYSLGQYDIARILQEEKGVPALVIEGDMNDSRVYAEEPVNNRIDAFLETLA